MEQSISRWPKVIAHRGVHVSVPENSLSSLRVAADRGARYVELDIQLSKSDEAMVFHDDSLRPLIDVKGKVSQFTTNELVGFRLRHRQSALESDDRIPTLEQWLQLAAKLKIGLNIELKGEVRNRLLVERTVALLQQNWSDDLPVPVLSSFTLDSLRHLQRLSLPYQHALLLERWPWRGLPKLLSHPLCVAVHISKEMATEKRVQRLLALGKRVCCYTVNDIDLAQALFDMGVQSVFTDNPDLLARYQS